MSSFNKKKQKLHTTAAAEKKPTIDVKKEPEDLKSLENYSDDRVELMHQIFTTLKSKTIQSIAPEFLQQKSIKELQDICLEEILGISKKRLLSIINAVKCPTDTESSDSEVDEIEEHISLEEISSDSNDDLDKRKRKSKRKIAGKNDKSTKKSEKDSKQNGAVVGVKQHSMLELLELQARARAIRSQLALEPVTKIELDDSDSEDKTVSAPEQSKQPTSASKQTAAHPNIKPSTSGSSETKATKTATNIATTTTNTNSNTTTTTTATAPRPIRLKRNFRQRQTDSNESDGAKENQQKSDESIEAKQTDSEPAPQQTVETKPLESTADIQSSQNDDDIIPIIAEPEILCISSSDDDVAKVKKEKKSIKRSYINMPVVVKEVRAPTEDEIFLQKIKEKSAEALRRKRNENSINKAPEDVLESDATEDKNGVKTEDDETVGEEQLEDGEIAEDDEVLEIDDSAESMSADGKKSVAQVLDKPTDSQNPPTNNEETNELDGASDASSCESSAEDEAKKTESKSPGGTKKVNVDDDDEDIIDLGDDDLDFEIKTVCAEPEEETNATSKSKSKSKKISKRDSSSPTENEPKNESWDKRWLRADKVSKVLATAKLANKVRSKIKEMKTKSSNDTVTATQLDEPNADIVNAVLSKVVVGSVEHYKELTKQK